MFIFLIFFKIKKIPLASQTITTTSASTAMAIVPVSKVEMVTIPVSRIEMVNVPVVKEGLCELEWTKFMLAQRTLELKAWKKHSKHLERHLNEVILHFFLNIFLIMQ